MLVGIINGLFQLYTLAIVVYCLMSWFPGALNKVRDVFRPDRESVLRPFPFYSPDF